jgi:hypothetical protein
MVRGRNFYRPMPSLEVTNEWQEWIIKKGVVHEEGDRTFTFNGDTPNPPPDPTPDPSRRSKHLQASSTTAGLSRSRTAIMPHTDDLVKELMAFQRTMLSWKAWEREVTSWEGTAEENPKKTVENIGVELAE